MSDAEAIELLERMMRYSRTYVEMKHNGPDVLITAWDSTGYGHTLKEALESWKANQASRAIRKLLS